jgi:sensor histidine kinase YesM
MIGDSLRVRINRAFIWILLSNIALMLIDALAFYSIGKIEPRFFVSNFLGNFLMFQFSYIVIVCFPNYINVYLSAKFPVKRATVHIVNGVCGLAIALAFLSLLNNMYFIIDENNVYHRQTLYLLSQVLGMAGIALNSVEIIRFRKSFNRIETFALTSYIVLPIIAVIIQTSVYGYLSVYIASTLTILFIYIGIQAQFQKKLKEKELQLTQSRIAIMLSQIQPHFLYSALSVILRLCDKDPAQAKKATIEFSNYLRGNKDFMLPALTVQAVVENAVKHSIGKQEGGGTIKISANETSSKYLVIVLEDDVGFDYEKAANNVRLCIGVTMSAKDCPNNAAVRLR